MVSSPKVMLTVVWDTQGFYIVAVLPKGATFDTDYSCKDILSEILKAHPVRSNLRAIIHADNATYFEANKRAHGEKQLESIPHPPFSPDPAAFDFFLLGYIQTKLQGTKFTKKDNLLTENCEFLNGMSGRVLKTVFIKLEAPTQKRWIRTKRDGRRNHRDRHDSVDLDHRPNSHRNCR
jgi:hypothetical protein